MKNSQKGFVVPLLIAIIALLLIGSGAYIYQNKKVEAPVVDTSTQQSSQTQQQTNTQIPPITNQQGVSISVLSPNMGERVPAGSSYLIRWNSLGISNRVLITLYVGRIHETIFSDMRNETMIPNNGSFTWKVPKSLDELNGTPVDHDYVAYITIQDAQNKNIIGQSNNFTIVPTKTTPSSVDTSNWKTYTSSQYGFSFQYPSGYQAKQPDGNLMKLPNKNNLIELYGSPDNILVTYASGPTLDFSTAKYGPDRIFFDANTNQWKQTDSNSYTGSMETGNIKLYYTISGLPYFYNATGISSGIVVPLSHNQFILFNASDNGPIQDVINQIVSTFVLKSTTSN